MDEIEFSKVVETMCRHPYTYTYNGTFMEATIFLEGFALGANVGGLKHQNAHSKFTPFFNWLANKQSRKYVGGGWRDFKEFYSNDATAFNALSQLYKEYAEEVCG